MVSGLVVAAAFIALAGCGAFLVVALFRVSGRSPDQAGHESDVG